MPTVRQCDVDPGTWAKLLAAAEQSQPARPVAPTVAADPPAVKVKPVLVEAAFHAPATWLLPIETASEANMREWRRRSSRTQAARRLVSKGLGPHLGTVAEFAQHFHGGGALTVVFTRLGGRALDKSNLPTALKATEDALALMLGADDGDPRWQPRWKQEPGGEVGVKIEIDRVPL